MAIRTLQRVIRSIPTSDGAGVNLRRSLGQTPSARLDPFLMLDEFSSENPDDYLAGFPDHPHRGFETVTYMLEGHMLHEDHLGHRGDLRSGGAQWMSAGRGIIHSEMPQQVSGRLHGFQLWINLPAHEKMKPAAYRDIQPEDIPQAAVAGAQVKVIAGVLYVQGRTVPGPIQGTSTDALLLDVRLPADSRFAHPVPVGHNVFVYPYEGRLGVRAADGLHLLETHDAGVLVGGETVEVCSVAGGSSFLVLAGRPLGEPVVQYGPFVMNTREEVEQAILDYQNGQLVAGNGTHTERRHATRH